MLVFAGKINPAKCVDNEFSKVKGVVYVLFNSLDHIWTVPQDCHLLELNVHRNHSLGLDIPNLLTL